MKRLVALFLVLLLSIESFAATVGDNDGAAFITKAEFDSLKSTFQSQIDQYNSSIDNKIDGAISGYLSGIRIAQKEKKIIIYNNWDEYIIVNNEIPQTYNAPKLTVSYSWAHNANFSISGRGNSVITNHQYHEQGSVFAGFRIPTQPGSKKNIVDVFKKTDGSISDESDGLDLTNVNVVWKGQCTDWHETVDIMRYDYLDGYNYGANEIGGAAGLKLWFLASFSFRLPSQGYFPGGLPLNSVWNPATQYTSTTFPDGRNLNKTTGWSNLSWSASASHFDFEHIGSYNDNVNWELSVPSWTNTFGLPRETNITSRTLYTLCNQYSRGGWIKDQLYNQVKNWPWDTDAIQSYQWWEVFMPNSVTANFTNSVSANVFDTETVSMPQIGLAGELNSNSILQTRDKVKYDLTAGKTFERDPLYLNEGYPLIYALKDSIVEWEPKFKDLSGTGVSDASEVNICFTYDKFGNGIACSNKYITKENDTSTTNMIWKTSGLTAKIKFIMPEDGFIIAKWWPGSLTAEEAKSVDFSITLDNKNSNFIYVTESD